MKPVALTCGDPAGVGPELSLLAWDKIRSAQPFFLIADRAHLAAMNSPIPIVEISEPHQSVDASAHGLPLLHHAFPAPNQTGQMTAQNALSVIDVIEQAVSFVKTGHAAAICTNPINKKALQDGAGFAYPGHTEFLAHLGGVEDAVMMLTAPELRVVPVTIHIPLKDVPTALTPELLEKTLRITHEALVADFGIKSPRIAVAGLNPHAGEGGSMGSEEGISIVPVLNQLRAQGLNISGPLSADTMFHPPARARYDVAVCMYHDQALIPIKTLNFAAGTNVTLGLPFIRTSPDHGTALDIAGKGIANPDSLIAAIRQAGQMAKTRQAAL